MLTSRTLFRPLAAILSVFIVATLVAAQADDSEPTAVASAESAAPVAGAVAAASYRLGAGDKVRVTVFDEKDLSGTFEVASDRTLALPLVGSVLAGGLTVRELERAIEDKLSDGFLKEPRVSAEITNYRPFYIIGEVNRPGSYPFVNDMTVVNAVALSGGYTYRARESSAFLIRAADPARKEQAVPPSTSIMPGDVIRIPERYF